MEGVSLIIAAYNAESTISELLDCVVRQTKQPDQVLIINDGSVDSTERICKSYCRSYPFFELVTVSNGGVSKARNIGIKKAKFNNIVFSDADDLLGNQYIEILTRYDADFIVSGYKVQNESNCWKTIDFPTKKVNVSEINEDPISYLGKFYFGITMGKVYKRNIILEHNLKFNESMKYWEDCEFNFNYLNKCSTVQFVSNSGYQYRYFPTSVSNNITREYSEKYLNDRIAAEKVTQQFFICLDSNQIEFLNQRLFLFLNEALSMNISLKNKYRIYRDPLFSSLRILGKSSLSLFNRFRLMRNLGRNRDSRK